MRSQRASKDELLWRGLDDYVHMAEVVAVVARGLEDEQAREACVALLRALLADGLVIAGDLTSDGFVPWELGLDATIRRIDEEWKALDRRPVPGDVCWFKNTEAGNARGQLVQAAHDLANNH